MGEQDIVRSRWENFNIFSRYIENFSGSGRYRSPLRRERVESFMVDVDRGVWYDFGLGRGGGVVSLVRELEGISSVNANDLCNLVGGSKQSGERYSSYLMPGRVSSGMPMRGELELVDSYGSYGSEMVRNRGIGYGVWLGMGCRSVKIWGRWWLYFDYGSGYKVVRVGDDGKKVVLTGGMNLGLWGECGGDMVLCEGEVDAMSLRECGYRGVSLSGGAMSLRSDQLEGYGGRVCMVYDADESGMNGMGRSGEILGSLGIEYMAIDLGKLLGVSGGYDINDYYIEHKNLNIIGENCGYNIGI